MEWVFHHVLNIVFRTKTDEWSERYLVGCTDHKKVERLDSMRHQQDISGIRLIRLEKYKYQVGKQNSMIVFRKQYMFLLGKVLGSYQEIDT